MSDFNVTNVFNISGNGNTVNMSQDIDNGSNGAEITGMVLKFLLTLLLSPILIPVLLAANGIKLLQDQRGGNYADD